MNARILALLIPFLILSPIWASIFAMSEDSNILSNLFSVLPDYLYSGGLQKGFNTCNPCTFFITVDHESKLFDDVRFDIKVYGGTSGYESECITINSADWAISHTRKSDWCQNHGYWDIGYEPTNPDWNSCNGYSSPLDVGDSIRCWKRRTVNPTYSTASYSSNLIWKMDSPDQYKGTENLAEILNSACRQNIEACYRYNQGEFEYVTKCNEPCKIGFSISSDVSAGGFDVKATPKVLTYSTQQVIPVFNEPSDSPPPESEPYEQPEIPPVSETPFSFVFEFLDRIVAWINDILVRIKV